MTKERTNEEDTDLKERVNKRIDEAIERYESLIKNTDKENPKPEHLAELKRYLDKNSALVRANEMSEIAFNTVIKAISKSALMQELTRRQISEKRDSFGYKDSSLIEKMLIDQVILCHLRLNFVETIYTGKLEDRHSLEHGIYWDKRLNSAQKRFMNACETLSKIRKHLAEAEHKEAQANHLRSKSAKKANDLLKQLTEN
ncbi:MAG: hypothetical protein LUM44_12600 [Pyrinomonadaceae bacterium]|nr:hypothetical protein [Pyrinomonadaceae bacterium]